ncbi:nuclear transport factor 2 family protein [Achromobacter animicus]|uniref:nuclear transport factor 2 family protein n=1 Tax=Achromobacter animicus TaxID=1389935 RepID=UPI00345F0F07
MSPKDFAAVEAACIRLSVDFANAVDARDYDRVVQLFTPQGAFNTPTHSLHGAAEIGEFLRNRPVELETRHFCTNFQVELGGEGEASGRFYVVCYKGAGETAGRDVPATPAPIVAEYHDKYIEVVDGWWIAERNVHMVFQP